MVAKTTKKEKGGSVELASLAAPALLLTAQKLYRDILKEEKKGGRRRGGRRGGKQVCFDDGEPEETPVSQQPEDVEDFDQAEENLEEGEGEGEFKPPTTSPTTSPTNGGRRRGGNPLGVAAGAIDNVVGGLFLKTGGKSRATKGGSMCTAGADLNVAFTEPQKGGKWKGGDAAGGYLETFGGKGGKSGKKKGGSDAMVGAALDDAFTDLAKAATQGLQSGGKGRRGGKLRGGFNAPLPATDLAEAFKTIADVAAENVSMAGGVDMAQTGGKRRKGSSKSKKLGGSDLVDGGDVAEAFKTIADIAKEVVGGAKKSKSANGKKKRGGAEAGALIPEAFQSLTGAEEPFEGAFDVESFKGQVDIPQKGGKRKSAKSTKSSKKRGGNAASVMEGFGPLVPPTSAAMETFNTNSLVDEMEAFSGNTQEAAFENAMKGGKKKAAKKDNIKQLYKNQLQKLQKQLGGLVKH